MCMHVFCVEVYVLCCVIGTAVLVLIKNIGGFIVYVESTNYSIYSNEL